MNPNNPNPGPPYQPQQYGPKQYETTYTKYAFSPEELRVLRECNHESFYQRSLPISTLLGLGTYYAVKSGMFKASPRWGAFPKVAAAVPVGYFVGKISYQSTCAEKLMALPNSRLAEVIRQRQRGGIASRLTPDQGFGAGLALAPFASASDTYSDEVNRPPSSSLDLDTSRPQQSELDDVYRPSLDSNTTNFDDVNLPLEPPKSSVTYDELRRQNREEYAKRQANPLYRPVGPEAPPVSRPSSPPPYNPPPEAPPPYADRTFGSDFGDRDARGPPKNKYGDPIQ